MYQMTHECDPGDLIHEVLIYITNADDDGADEDD